MGDVIDALKFAFMGSFEARQGQWGLWTDLVYADFGASKIGTRDFSIGGRPLPVGHQTPTCNSTSNRGSGPSAGMYNLADAEYRTDLLFGARCWT